MDLTDDTAMAAYFADCLKSLEYARDNNEQIGKLVQRLTIVCSKSLATRGFGQREREDESVPSTRGNPAVSSWISSSVQTDVVRSPYPVAPVPSAPLNVSYVRHLLEDTIGESNSTPSALPPPRRKQSRECKKLQRSRRVCSTKRISRRVCSTKRISRRVKKQRKSRKLKECKKRCTDKYGSKS